MWGSYGKAKDVFMKRKLGLYAAKFTAFRRRKQWIWGGKWNKDILSYVVCMCMVDVWDVRQNGSVIHDLHIWAPRSGGSQPKRSTLQGYISSIVRPPPPPASQIYWMRLPFRPKCRHAQGVWPEFISPVNGGRPGQGSWPVLSLKRDVQS